MKRWPLRGWAAKGVKPVRGGALAAGSAAVLVLVLVLGPNQNQLLVLKHLVVLGREGYSCSGRERRPATLDVLQAAIGAGSSWCSILRGAARRGGSGSCRTGSWRRTVWR